MNNHRLVTSVNKFTKSRLLVTALLTSLLVVGCGSKPSESADTASNDASSKVTTDSSKATTEVSKEDTLAASALVDQVMGTMASAMQMANKMAESQEGGQAKFSNEQINCFITYENKLAIDNIQSYLEDSFSKDELNELNAFFGSEAGKKQSEVTKKMIAAMMGDGDMDLASMQGLLSEEEQQEIDAFWKSATGAKLQQALNNQQKMEPFIQPFIKAKEEKCVPEAK